MAMQILNLQNRAGFVRLLKGKNVVVVDDVISTGHMAKSAISDLKDQGANPILMVVMVNKTPLYELDDIPVRSLIRARQIV